MPLTGPLPGAPSQVLHHKGMNEFTKPSPAEVQRSNMPAAGIYSHPMCTHLNLGVADSSQSS